MKGKGTEFGLFRSVGDRRIWSICVFIQFSFRTIVVITCLFALNRLEQFDAVSS